MPGMWARVFFFEESLAFTTGRLAELGLRGVHILKRRTMPFRCGDFLSFGRLHL